MSARAGQVTDEFERPVPGATIYVYNEDKTAASVYSDAGLTILLSQPILTDQFGNYIYYAKSAVYREDTWYGAKLRFREVVAVGLDGLYPPAPRAGQFFAFDAAGDPVAASGTGADAGLRTDLAATTGSSLLGWIAAAVGAVARTIAAKLSDTPSLKDFGAKGDAVLATDLSSIISGTDDTAAVLAAFADLSTKGGGSLFAPKGKYLISSYLTVPANVKLIGAHRKASIFVTNMAGGGGASTDQNIRNGSILYSNWPSNSATPANISLEHIGFIFTNPANQGAAFYDNGGTYLSLRHGYFHGGAYGALFDQSELFDVDLSLFESQTAAGVRLVNGASVKAGNAGVYTNRGSVKRSQFNVGATVHCILDEGGMAHAYEDNNFNGGLNQIHAESVDGLSIRGGEWESSAGANIYLLNCITDVWGGAFNVTTGNAAIACDPAGGGQLSVGGSARFSGGGTTATAAITGVANLFAYWQGLVVNQMFNGQPTVDGTATNHYDTTGKPVGRAVATVPGTGFLTAPQIAFQATATSSATGDVLSMVLDHGASGGQVYLQSLLRDSVTQYSDFVIRARGADAMGERGRFNETGLLLPAATHIYVGGTQVVAARQTGTAANATDLATAITLVNDLKTKLTAHGLIS